MSTPYETAIGSWAGRSTFFWAATGATVGLSNLWKFPYLAGENGGGLFILLYLGCLLLVTLPLMLTETALGQSARHGVVLAVDGLVQRSGRSRHWVWVGRLSVFSGFLVLSFTAVIGAICLAYVFYSALGMFVGASEQDIANTLSNLVESPSGHRSFMAWHACFLTLVAIVSVQGVAHGLERAFRVVMPTFLLLLLGLLVFSARYGDLPKAVDYMLRFHPQDLSWHSLQLALAHAFYTLGLGMGVWVIFGSYMPSIAPLKRSVFAVALMDTLVAIVAGLAIYGLVLGQGSGEAEQGFGLVFLALPVSFSHIVGGQFVATAMFVAILLVSWTSALALLEPVVGWFQEWVGGPRGWSAIFMVVAAWLAGLGTLYSFNIWADNTLAGGTLFRWIEILTGGLFIPVVGVTLAIFVGWVVGPFRAFSLIGKTPQFIAKIWFWVLRWVLPPVVVFIGGQYAFSSLGTLCETPEKAGWCAVTPVVSVAEPTPSTPDGADDQPSDDVLAPGDGSIDSPAGVKADESSKTGDSVEPVDPGDSEPARRQETSDVEAADDGDLLYDSV